MTAIDPVTVEVLRNALANACETMKVTVERTAYSSVITEVVDYSVAIIDPEGNLIAETAGLPVFLATLSHSVLEVDDVIGYENLDDGDIIFCNDPYSGGFSHNPDVTVMKPVFADGELLAFTCFRGHVLDMGSRTPGGWLNNCENVYQDGVCFPPVKLFTAGSENEDVTRLIQRSTRYPETVMGDIRAMVSAVRVGDDRLSQLLSQYGRETYDAATSRMLENAEGIAREAVAALPDGTYAGEYAADGDGDDDDPITDEIRVKMEMTIDGDEMHIDFSGSDEQTNGPMNCPGPTTESVVRMGFKGLTTPNDANNEGYFEPLTVETPSGTVVDPEPPASCALNWIHVGGIPDLMLKLLEDEIPDDVTASHFGTPCANFVYGLDPRTERGYMLVEGDAGGWGAMPDADGQSALFTKELGDTRNTPIEVLESQYPLRAEAFTLVEDSGGPGEYRGGLGVRRSYTPVDHDAQITATFDRQERSPPWGVCGGEEAGRVNSVYVDRADGDRERWGKLTDVTVAEEETMHFQTGGGGGYGHPHDRDPEAVRADVIDGYVSREQAAERYGVVVTEGGELDREATADRREAAATDGSEASGD
ncbi:hydantoinase B/oxoprolinase family protein [Halovivax gelatinilyticus]|uniref:hydantoinase B/oxoprolinase family protein n=1 Tax=Halovivax gelatinilyticus TaxID=2961597 RepID=UPI0020CA5E79|nr:hydantoinase B/oxoprolinase family protein [Halovivax gelatinilyticus]